MAGKHYNWHKRWTVDLLAASATHDSGLTVRFLASGARHEADPVIGKCRAQDGCEWEIVVDRANMQAVHEALLAMNGPHNAPKMFARLIREAGETWVWHKARERK